MNTILDPYKVIDGVRINKLYFEDGKIEKSQVVTSTNHKFTNLEKAKTQIYSMEYKFVL